MTQCTTRRIWSTVSIAIAAALLSGPGSAGAEGIKLYGIMTPANTQFGSAAAVGGGLVVIGAPKDDGAASASGAAYVFDASGAFITKLVASDGVTNAGFGRAVAVDGDLIVIGAPSQLGFQGAAYVFRFDGAAWSEEAILTAPGLSYWSFGFTVAVSGEQILVTCSNIYDGTALNTGAAFFFGFDGNEWGASGLAQTSGGGTSGDLYGRSSDIDGTRAVVGAATAAKAYLYESNGSVWQSAGVINAPGGGGGSRFGDAVGLHDDTLVIGAPLDSQQGSNAGAAHVYRQVGGSWIHEQKLLPPATSPPQAVNGSRFGDAVSIHADRIVVGAPESSGEEDVEKSGAAFVYDHNGSAWLLTSSPADMNPAFEDLLGSAVAIGPSAMVVGIPNDDDTGTNEGSALLLPAPDAPRLLGDLNGDGVVDGADLGILLGAWGGPGGDLNGDGTTDGADVGVLLSQWNG